jgi:transposase InsO family protein
VAGTRTVHTPAFRLRAARGVTDRKPPAAEAARRPGVAESRPRDREEGHRQEGGRRLPRPRPPDATRRGEPAAPGRRRAPGGGARRPKKSRGVLRRPDEVALAGVEGRGGGRPVTHLCRVPEASRPGSYARRPREPSAAEARRGEVVTPVTAARAGGRGRCGGPRTHAELVARGVGCGATSVAKAMREAGVAAKARRKSRRAADSNRPRPAAGHVSGRDSDPGEPNALRAAGVTHTRTREGWLYPAAVGGLFGRRAVGRSTGAATTSRLVVGAPGVASAGRLRGSSPPAPAAHPDRGSRYASGHYRRRLSEERIACGESRRGNCRDDAAVGSSFAGLKKGAGPRRGPATREEARASTSGHVEAFANRVRRHSALGYAAPDEYERTHNRTHR